MVANATKPIEIWPGSSFRPTVLWQYSMEGWDKSTAFETTDDGEALRR